MKYGISGMMVIALCGVLLAPTNGLAHHPIPGKFDPASTATLEGIVTYVDWRDPHAHIFVNVGTDLTNWAIELPSPIDLQASGWTRESLRPGDAVTVEGITARDGSRQIWSQTLSMTATGRPVLAVRDTSPLKPLVPRPVPRWPDGQARLGSADAGAAGYWAFPSSTSLVEDGRDVEMDEYGLLANINDAARVAPLQPWALGLFKSRQERFLQDDPMYRMCKPPGGPRQFQEPHGIELIEDRRTQRVFVNIGSGNHNFRLLFLDGREAVGQLGGDDDNPLYYGRSVGEWDGDTLVVQTNSFNEDFWFSRGGLPHSNLLSMTEQFTRVDFDTLRYEVTIDDPGAYTRPWSATWTLEWVSGDLPFHLCQENRP